MKISERIGVVRDLFESLIVPAPKRHKAKIALVGIGFAEHFDWESVKVNYASAQETLLNVLPKDNFELLVSPEPLQFKGEILEWLEQMKHQDVDGIIIYQASYIQGDLAATTARWFVQNQVPVLSWSHDEVTGGRLSNNRLCGQNFFLNILSSNNVKYSWLFESPSSPTLGEHLLTFAKAAYAKAAINQKTILMAGGFRVPGFYDCELNEMAILRRMGLSVDRVDMETLWRHGAKFAAEDIAKICKALQENPRCAYCNVPEDQMQGSIRLALSIADYARANGYLGVALKNWPELFDNYTIAGDGAGALIQDLGIPVADESDMGALITMVLADQLTLGEGVPALFDLSLINPETNKIGLWHCGGASTRLIREGRNYELRKHSILENYDLETSLGMMMEFLHELGDVTVAKALYPNADKMFSWEGVIEESEMAYRGSYAQVQPQTAEAKDILYTMLNNGMDHHWIAIRGHVMEEIHELNHFLGVENCEMEQCKGYLHGRSK